MPRRTPIPLQQFDGLVGVAVRCLALLVIALFGWVVVQALATVGLVTSGVLMAVLLAALLNPLAGSLGRLGAPPWLAAMVAVLAVVGFVTGVLLFVVRGALGQGEQLRRALRDGIDRLREFLVGPPVDLSPARVDELGNRLLELVLGVLPSPSGGAVLAMDIASALLLALVTLFFVLKDGPHMWAWAISWAPAGRRDRFDTAGQLVWRTLTRYVHGVVVVALVDSVLIGAAMFLIGVPLALSLALMVFIGAFVPYVGAFVSGTLAVTVTFVTVSPVMAGVLLAVVIGVELLEGNVLDPLILGYAVRLHPVVVLVSVTSGALLAGIVGAVVAVPLVAVAYRLVEFVSTREAIT